jgi:NAD(P)-dependent dehydrogenase (short-subunit alcohol dehydrogenase family)
VSGVAVVTGAARGIGRAIAERLLADGLQLILPDRSEQVVECARELERSGTVTPVVADLGTEAGLAAVAGAVETADGPLRVLVNNAGITRDGRLAKLTPDDFLAVMRVNLGVPFQLTRRLAPRFASGGAVVNISSRAYLGNVGQFNYSASKGGVVGLTRALALELAPRVRVNAVAPGLIATDMTAAMPEKVRDKLVAAVPLQRMGQPAEVAETVAYLCSSRSDYVTGQVLIACGGRSLAR